MSQLVILGAVLHRALLLSYDKTTKAMGGIAASGFSPLTTCIARLYEAVVPNTHPAIFNPVTCNADICAGERRQHKERTLC